MNFMLIIGLLSPANHIDSMHVEPTVAQHEAARNTFKLAKGTPAEDLIAIMGKPISVSEGHTSFTHDKTETYTFKSSTHCTSYADVCSVVIRYNKVWKFLDVRPEYLASK